MGDKIKYFIGCGVPVFSCNFRCTYCYLGQHPDLRSRGIIPFAQEPEYIADFFSKERLGGLCYFNFCGNGETLLHPEIIDLVTLLTKNGHYCDIITNGTVSRRFDELISRLDINQRKHLLIKFSFHWMELKHRNLMDTFVDNVYKIKNSGISYSIEITPHDELIPHIEEIKKFSLEKFGALPHITVARNEATPDIELLTKLNRNDYKNIWSSFDSGMFDFKFSIFNEKRCEFCYAGLWSLQLVLETGEYFQCYGGDLLGNIKNKEKPIAFRAIGKCRQPHCFNGHAYLTFGDIPELEAPTYNVMRDRVCEDGNHWVQEETQVFFNSKLIESHDQLSDTEKQRIIRMDSINKAASLLKLKTSHAIKKIKKD